MKMKKLIPYTLLLMFFCSCASIINTSRQYVPITSNPPGATVSLNGKEFGKTPTGINMKRKNKEHILNLTLDGYEPYQTNLVRVVDGWIIGNIVIGGLIGLGIDAISGGMYHLNPKRIDIPLKQVETKSSK